MALYDENGKITIEENEAKYDIRQIEVALQSLENSKRTLTEIIRQANDTQGDTGVAIVEKAAELKQQIIDMTNRLNEAAAFISKTVAHYQWLDQKVKTIINSSDIDSEGVNHGGSGRAW